MIEGGEGGTNRGRAGPGGGGGGGMSELPSLWILCQGCVPCLPAPEQRLQPCHLQKKKSGFGGCEAWHCPCVIQVSQERTQVVLKVQEHDRRGRHPEEIEMTFGSGSLSRTWQDPDEYGVL